MGNPPRQARQAKKKTRYSQNLFYFFLLKSPFGGSDGGDGGDGGNSSDNDDGGRVGGGLAGCKKTMFGQKKIILSAPILTPAETNILVLLSASVKRFGVSCMRNLKKIAGILLTTCMLEKDVMVTQSLPRGKN